MEPRETTRSLEERSAETVERLAGLYGWQLDADARLQLAGEMTEAHLDTGDLEPSPRSLEQTCCRLWFARLHADLDAGGAATESALHELFHVTWTEGDDESVRYGGYLFRTALLTLRRRLAGSSLPASHYDQIACDAASRALTQVQARFRDCRDPDAFWGWAGRVAERATIDELRSGQATGGRSVRAQSLDATVEPVVSGRTAAAEEEQRHVDAVAVRHELVRKCRLGKLSADQREALVRSFWGQEKPQEIAATLSAERGSRVTPAQVSLWKHRGLQVMEANLREQGFS